MRWTRDITSPEIRDEGWRAVNQRRLEIEPKPTDVSWELRCGGDRGGLPETVGCQARGQTILWMPKPGGQHRSETSFTPEGVAPLQP